MAKLNEVFSYSDPAVQALQFLDVIGMKDPSQKAQFFRTTLTEVFPYIPRVRIGQSGLCLTGLTAN